MQLRADIHTWLPACPAPPAVPPPGWYWSGSATLECPQGTFKDSWEKSGLASCKPCGTGLWLSDKNTLVNKLDPNTGAVAQQVAVRGSSDSCCEYDGPSDLIRGCVWHRLWQQQSQQFATALCMQTQQDGAN